MKKENTTITIQLPIKLKEAVDELAIKEEIPSALVIRLAIKAYLKGA